MRKKLLTTMALVFVLSVAFVVTAGQATAPSDAAVLVPDCDCMIYNDPEPGDSYPGLRDWTGECQADPCSTDLEKE